jgi:hypothetical protein
MHGIQFQRISDPVCIGTLHTVVEKWESEEEITARLRALTAELRKLRTASPFGKKPELATNLTVDASKSMSKTPEQK